MSAGICVSLSRHNGYNCNEKVDRSFPLASISSAQLQHLISMRIYVDTMRGIDSINVAMRGWWTTNRVYHDLQEPLKSIGACDIPLSSMTFPAIKIQHLHMTHALSTVCSL